MGPHPRRGPGVRRRAAQRRAEARGLGLPELRRHRHRRRALLQARPQPRPRRPARRPELLPHEVAAQPAAGPPGAPGDRGLHRRVRALPEGRQGRPQGGRDSWPRRARRSRTDRRRGAPEPVRDSGASGPRVRRLTSDRRGKAWISRSIRPSWATLAALPEPSHHRPGHAVSLGGRARGQRLRRALAAELAAPGTASWCSRRRTSPRWCASRARRIRSGELFDPDGGVRVLGVGELLPLAGSPPRRRSRRRRWTSRARSRRC